MYEILRCGEGEDWNVVGRVETDAGGDGCAAVEIDRRTCLFRRFCVCFECCLCHSSSVGVSVVYFSDRGTLGGEKPEVGLLSLVFFCCAWIVPPLLGLGLTPVLLESLFFFSKKMGFVLSSFSVGRPVRVKRATGDGINRCAVRAAMKPVAEFDKVWLVVEDSTVPSTRSSGIIVKTEEEKKRNIGKVRLS